ncbi:MAG: sugar ABC transporter substrate-binding protein [Chloroflexota bacterium]
MNRRWTLSMALIAVLALFVSACATPAASPAPDAAPAGDEAAEETQVMQSGLVFGFASHEAPGDSGFWGIVEKGCKDAAASLGAECKSAGSIDPVEQAQIVSDYVAEGVDGIIVSLANPEAMADSVRAAVAAGIPVITMNSGVNNWEELGALTHVGQSEFPAGAGAGKRMDAAGLAKVVCVVHEESNIALEERCDGLESTFSGEVERFNVASTGTGDIAGTSASIQDKLTADDSVDGILTLNPDVAIAALDAMKSAGVTDRVTLGTFDLSGPVVEAIQAGEIIFGIDQQPYLQGYLPATMLHLYNTNLNVVGGGLPVLTGPGFVTPDNAEAVAELAAGGTR